MKYSPEKAKEICGFLEEGLNRNDACDLADISMAAFYEWMKKVDFADAIKKAELKLKRGHIANIRRAAISGTWQASAWWLERRHKLEFALRQELTGPGGEAIEVARKVEIILKQFSIPRHARIRKVSARDITALSQGGPRGGEADSADALQGRAGQPA